jgi:breast cancer 2 susceptibility protein
MDTPYIGGRTSRSSPPPPLLSFQVAVKDGILTASACDCEPDGVDPQTMAVNSLNAALLRFDVITERPVAFSPLVSIESSAVVGSYADYRSALLDKGCDCSLVTDKWIHNHIRWIVWKLASRERRFSCWLGGSYLTFSRAVAQLHHRFMKEILQGSRPILRKVLNRDISASCLMILCVADIRTTADSCDESTESNLLELTDGWYSVRTCIDCHLNDFVRDRRIRLGTKLLVSSACLVGCEDGVDPNDEGFDAFAVHSPTLKVSVNTTRLAKWDAKLGRVHHAASSPRGSRDGLLLVSKVSDVVEGGGNVPLIDLLVVRKYPLKYLQKTGDGQSHLVTEGEEVHRRMTFDQERQRIVDQYSEEIQKECQKVSELALKRFHIAYHKTLH